MLGNIGDLFVKCMPQGVSDRGYVSWGKCPGGTCLGGFCPVTLLVVSDNYVMNRHRVQSVL